MTRLGLLQLAVVLLLLTFGGGIGLRGTLARQDRLAARRRAVQNRQTQSIAGPRRRSGPGLRVVVGAFGSRILSSGLLSTRTQDTFRTTLASAGLPPHAALDVFVGCKLLLLLGMPVVGWIGATHAGLSGPAHWAVVTVSGIAGMLLPDFVIKRLRIRHLARVERGLPDALDMLIICTEAGMAIEPALQRVGQELGFAHPATAAELTATSVEARLTGDPRGAFVNLAARAGLESLRRLGVTVVQTLEYGTPLARALRLLANELRDEMITRFEEKAARLPVMLTLPMILFILPALFLIIGGPVAIRVIEMMNR